MKISFYLLKSFFSAALLAVLIPSTVLGQHPLQTSFEAYQKAKASTPFGTEWMSCGPVVNSARVEAVQADPNRPGTMYAAFGSGNLWKTENNGLTWKAIFENQVALGIGDIALAPSNSDIIYLGTGESLRKNRNFTMPGNGVYRSDDGGENWRHLGLDDSWHIGEIAVHPSNPDIAFVAVLGKFWSKGRAKGLYRTQDGGRSWQRVLYINENTRANDVVIAPSNPNIIYTSVWENNIDTVLIESVYGPKSGVYKSEDGGDTWKKLENGLPKNPKVGRIGLAVSHQNPDKVYALIDNRNKADMDRAEVYKTTDGGSSWNRTHQEDLHIFSVIGWYFADMYVNPQNDEEIFGLGVRIAHSTNGGKTFDLVGGRVEHLHPSPAQALHLDHCEMWINPLNPQHIVLGNDGGLFVTYDKGENWLHHNNIPAGEFYDITLDNQTPYLIYGGTQDDATVYGPAKAWKNIDKDPWKYLWIDPWSGGDGCVTQVDPDDPNTVYYSSQEGYIYRKDMASDRSKLVTPRRIEEYRDTLAYHFITPYFISPHDAQTIYHGGNFVFKTTDRGDHWEKISPDLSLPTDPQKRSLATSALAESSLKAGLLYAGTEKGAFWYSENDGQHWQENSEGLPTAYIRSICPSKFSPSRVYLAMSGINYDDLNKYVFVSEDHGKTWTSIAANLPNEPVNVILEDPNYENILYAGAYRGVYISMDRGQSWNLMGQNLPAASIGDLEIQEREKELVVGTHGRGIYYVNLAPIYALNEKGFPLTENTIFSIPEVLLPRWRNAQQNVEQTAEPLPISFWSTKNGPVQIQILDKEEQTIWTKEIQARQGFNQFCWDMVLKRNESDMPYFTRYEQYIRSGDYTVVFNFEGAKLQETLKIRND